MTIQPSRIITLSFIAIAIFFVAAAGFVGYLYFQSHKNNISLSTQLEELHKYVSIVSTELINTKSELADAKNANNGLAQALLKEQIKNGSFETQIKEISGTVSILKKLSATDQELLKKYSKIYFLNENYIPSALSIIAPQYVLNKTKQEQIHANVAPFLKAMLDAAALDKADFEIVSAYRSYAEQVSVKTGYKILYGSGANTFSADQGYSEHQLGTTIDLATPELKTLTTDFEKSEAYKWLDENAYKFGFILSYPKDNTFYRFEPWHWRFVGTALAKKLHDENKHFYDLDQREISQYLISIFD